MRWRGRRLFSLSSSSASSSAATTLPRFYVDGLDAKASVVTIEGKEAAHATKVLRMKPMDEIEVCDGRGRVARCAITAATSSGRGRGRVTAAIESVRLEPWSGVRWELCIAGGSVKGARGDWIVEKATELPSACSDTEWVA